MSTHSHSRHLPLPAGQEEKNCLAIFDFPRPRVSLLSAAWHPAPPCCSERLMTALGWPQMMLLFSQRAASCDRSCPEFALWKHKPARRAGCVFGLSHRVSLPQALCSGGLKSTCARDMSAFSQWWAGAWPGCLQFTWDKALAHRDEESVAYLCQTATFFIDVQTPSQCGAWGSL